MGTSKAKRTITMLFSAGFYVVLRLWELIRRMAGGKVEGACVVIYYHAVSPEHRARFARQMDALIRSTKPVPAGLKAPLAPGQQHCAVTFDDGFESVVENALPELEKRKIPFTLFIVTDALGQSPGWGEYASDEHVGDRVLSADQLRRLPPDLVSIGSHTVTHPMLPALDEAEARRELRESRARLEEILGKKVDLFSFPYGTFNPKLVDWCREAGYARVFTILPAMAFSTPEEFITGRVAVETSDWPLEFRLKLLGAYRWLTWAFALKRRLLAIPATSAAPKLNAEACAEIAPRPAPER